VCDEITEDGYQFGITSKDISTARSLYVETPDIRNITAQLTQIEFSQYSSVALILLNHGSPDGVFGNCLTSKVCNQCV
jgi:hypothetical protein